MEQFLENFKCIICLEFAEVPYESWCCSNLMCRGCYFILKDKKSNCPTCRASFFDAGESKLLRRIIGDIPCKCEDCGDNKLTRSMIDDHKIHFCGKQSVINNDNNDDPIIVQPCTSAQSAINDNLRQSLRRKAKEIKDMVTDQLTDLDIMLGDTSDLEEIFNDNHSSDEDVVITSVLRGVKRAPLKRKRVVKKSRFAVVPRRDNDNCLISSADFNLLNEVNQRSIWDYNNVDWNIDETINLRDPNQVYYISKTTSGDRRRGYVTREQGNFHIHQYKKLMRNDIPAYDSLNFYSI